MVKCLKGRTWLVSVPDQSRIISDITNPFFTSVVRGVEDVANARGYSLILGNTDEDLTKEKSYLRLLESKRVDGLIVAVTLGNHGYLRSWPTHRLPLVSIDRLPDDVSIDAVLIDNVAGARQAVEHLITLGHERIGIVTGLPGITTTEERLTGVRSCPVRPRARLLLKQKKAAVLRQFPFTLILKKQNQRCG